jgi:uncharacterized membrane protein
MNDDDPSRLANNSLAQTIEQNAHLNGVRGMGRTLMQRLRGYFLAGILFTAPLSITIYLTYIFLTFIDSRVSKVLPDGWYHALYGTTTFPGIGLIIAIVFFVSVGWLATNVLGKLIIRISEYVLNRMPIIRTLYGATKQIFETVMASQSSAFRDVVMFEYPRKGIWVLGFVTGVSEGEVQRLTEDMTVNVFLPTTPNPTSGFLLFVPKKDLVYMDMSVEQAIKLVVSGGILTPPDLEDVERQQEAELKKKTDKVAKSVAKAKLAKTPAKPKAPKSPKPASKAKE